MSLFDEMKSFPIYTGMIGTVSGWASFDLLRTSQIFAGIMAGIVSGCTLIVVAPKALAVVCEWWGCKKKKRKYTRRPPLL